MRFQAAPTRAGDGRSSALESCGAEPYFMFDFPRTLSHANPVACGAGLEVRISARY
jgi:hypothetical protein